MDAEPIKRGKRKTLKLDNAELSVKDTQNWCKQERALQERCLNHGSGDDGNETGCAPLDIAPKTRTIGEKFHARLHGTIRRGVRQQLIGRGLLGGGDGSEVY